MQPCSTLLILAAGLSSRMKKSQAATLSKQEVEEVNSINKALIKLSKDGTTLIDYLVAHAIEAKFEHIIIVVGLGGKESILQHTTISAIAGKTKVYFATQHMAANRKKPMGTADAVFQAMRQYPQLFRANFVMCNSDNLYSTDSLNAIKQTPHANALVAYDRAGLAFSQTRIAALSLIKLDPENYLADIIEKPTAAMVNQYKDKDGRLRVNMNLLKFDSQTVFPFLEKCPINPLRQEKEITTVLMNMVEQNPKAIVALPRKEHVPDLTSKQDISTLKNFISNMKTSVHYC